MHTIAIMLAMLIPQQAMAEELAAASLSSKDAKVLFWQTNLISGNQGTCGVDFFFDGASLSKQIEHLVLRVRIIDAGGSIIGTEEMALRDPLGGFGFQRYTTASLSSPAKWQGQDDGVLSPLCDSRTHLVIESALGIQGDRKVDLVRYHQLSFTSFPRITVKTE